MTANCANAEENDDNRPAGELIAAQNIGLDSNDVGGNQILDGDELREDLPVQHGLVKGASKLWPDGIVYYYISNEYSTYFFLLCCKNLKLISTKIRKRTKIKSRVSR